jgi:hypothetical protein
MWRVACWRGGVAVIAGGQVKRRKGNSEREGDGGKLNGGKASGRV